MTLSCRAMTPRRIPVILLLGLLTPANAYAQKAFTTVEALRTRAETGDEIYVMDREGRETKGSLMALSDNTLTIGVLGDRYDVPLERVARIDRDGDSVWSGFAIGAGIGAVMGLLAAQGCSGDSTAMSMFGGAMVYGGIGALIDGAHTGRTRIYAAPLDRGNRTTALAPIVSRERKGVALAIRW